MKGPSFTCSSTRSVGYCVLVPYLGVDLKCRVIVLVILLEIVQTVCPYPVLYYSRFTSSCYLMSIRQLTLTICVTVCFLAGAAGPWPCLLLAVSATSMNLIASADQTATVLIATATSK